MVNLFRPPLVARANHGLTFRPDANTVLWLPGQDDAYSSTIRDRSGNGNDGTITGATWKQTGQGLWNQEFDGVDDVVTITHVASLNTGTAITVKTWLNKVVGWPHGFTSGIAASKNDSWEVDVTDTNGQVRFIFKDATVQKVVNGDGMTDLTWHHIVCTYDGATGHVYIDGVDGTPLSYSGSIDTNGNDLSIGREIGNARLYQGGVDLFLLRNTAWTVAQVLSSYNEERHHFGV